MRVHHQILENLKSDLRLADIEDTDISDKIIDGSSVELYRCENCGYICDEDGLGSKRVNLEYYYGVSDLFPDSHYGDITVCDKCGSEDIEDLGWCDLEDFEDASEYADINPMNEGTKWTSLTGKKYRYMDEFYMNEIITKLFPMLRQYGINMLNSPVKEGPGVAVYMGRDENDKQISLEFINKYEPGLKNREGENDMFVKASYGWTKRDVGMIDLSTEEGIEQAFSLITMTLEDITNEDIDDKEEEENNNDDYDQELEDLANFKSSLSEQELLRIERED